MVGKEIIDMSSQEMVVFGKVMNKVSLFLVSEEVIEILVVSSDHVVEFGDRGEVVKVRHVGLGRL